MGVQSNSVNNFVFKIVLVLLQNVLLTYCQ